MTDAPAPPALSSPPQDAPRTPRPYRKAPPEVWVLIQEEYTQRTPAPVLAERHGVSSWAIRKRASLGGWTHRETARRTLGLDLPKLGGDRRPPEVAAAKADADAAAALALAEARARATAAQAEADAEEADPLEAARTLLRRAAASAVAGRLAQAGASVKLAEGLARAAAVLGLGDGAQDGWGEEEDEPRLSPEALEALRDDVERRYARFDRPEAGLEDWSGQGAEAMGEGSAPVGEGVAVGSVVAAEAAGEPLAGAAEAAAAAAAAAVDAIAPAWRVEAAPSRGISRPPRSLSASPWPAWAGPPDTWARSGGGA